MKEDNLAAILLTFLFASSLSHAQDLTPTDCTTADTIQFANSMRVPQELNSKQVHDVVLVALGSADVEVSWARDTFDGQWFLEYQDDSVMFAGYSVRSHYLQVAIMFADDKITTIVCDSRNLNQSDRKIHRKVPGWKGTLDDNIRIAMGQAAEYYRQQPKSESDESLASRLDHLNALQRSGILTDEEYRDLKQRILDN